MNVRGPGASRPAPHHDDAPAKASVAFIVPQDDGRFGEPSDYGLTADELGGHIGCLRARGWQLWELLVRFGRVK